MMGTTVADVRVGSGPPGGPQGQTHPKRPLRVALLYGGLVVGPLVVVAVVLALGPDGAAGGQTVAAGADPHLVARFFLAVAAVVCATRVGGALARRLGQPRVVGEIAAGLALGPSVLGALAPRASSALFPAEVIEPLELLAQLGLVVFMFLVGLESRSANRDGTGHLAVAVSHVSIAVPLCLGVLTAPFLFDRFAADGTGFVAFALFLGLSMSITAFPVMARILAERDLLRSRLGTVALTCAAVDDVTAWCLLAVLVAVTGAGSVAEAALMAPVAVLYVVVMVRVLRPLLAGLERRGRSLPLPFVLAATLLSAYATDRIGIHAIFGAFLLGTVMPAGSAERTDPLVGQLEGITVSFLLPLFFAATGLHTELGLLGTDVGLWLVAGLVLVVAVTGKWAGTAVAARTLGLPWAEASALGVLMNCRGLTELVVLTIGLELGIITPTLFAMLVVMALVTTVMTTPLLARLAPEGRRRERRG